MYKLPLSFMFALKNLCLSSSPDIKNGTCVNWMFIVFPKCFRWTIWCIYASSHSERWPRYHTFGSCCFRRKWLCENAYLSMHLHMFRLFPPCVHLYMHMSAHIHIHSLHPPILDKIIHINCRIKYKIYFRVIYIMLTILEQPLQNLPLFFFSKQQCNKIQEVRSRSDENDQVDGAAPWCIFLLFLRFWKWNDLYLYHAALCSSKE